MSANGQPGSQARKPRIVARLHEMVRNQGLWNQSNTKRQQTLGSETEVGSLVYTRKKHTKEQAGCDLP